MLVLWGAMGALLGLWTGDLRIGRGGLSPRGIPTKTHNSCGTDSRRPTRTLGPPPGLLRAQAPSACNIPGGIAWIQRVQPQSVPQCRGSWSKRQALGAEPSLNHHSGGQPVRVAGHWRDHVGQPDHRDGLCRPCRPSTTRRGQAPCTANHQPRELAQTGEMATSRPLPDLSTL